MSNKVIILPNGNRCGIGRYVKAWKALKAMHGSKLIDGFGRFGREPARNILYEMRLGLHDRINRHDAAYGKGRKWAERYQTDLHRDVGLLQCIHNRIRIYQFNSQEARSRFSHLLSSHED